MTQTPQQGGSSLDLSTKLLPELRSIATQMGIKGARAMRKADLIAAIRQGAQGDVQPPSANAAAQSSAAAKAAPRRRRPAEDATPDADGESAQGRPAGRRAGGGAREQSGQREDGGQRQHSRRRPAAQSADEQSADVSVGDLLDAEARRHAAEKQSGESSGDQRPNRREADQPRRRARNTDASSSEENVSDEVGARLEALSRGQRGERTSTDRGNRNGNGAGNNSGESDEDYGHSEYGNGGRRSRRRRQRDRQNRRKRSNGFSDNEPNVREDDVLVPCSGILDIRDQYAFVRTSGYLPGSDDAYVSMSMVRRMGLRKGDVIVGQMRAHREGERREKFAPLVRVEQVNGADPEQMRQRPEFAKLTPLYPQERLRLEDDPKNMTGRIIDLVSPIGKGQRGLIVSPPKAGKTMIMQSIANSITRNNPEVHLMVVLVDERPEEVTDFQRTVTGEVIASTFDRPADDHTQLSELAIERAKRLVELGHDVVILLDGITRLGRAYNLAAPASGRILSGGVDSAALYPPKKFFGAARNIEHGGSLTILATALVETGSKMDEVIFEEFKGTGNMELRLRREFANKRLFPAIDVDASGTRREELLLSREETAIMWKLRRVLSGLEGSQALEMMLSRLRKTQTNVEFLYTISKTTPNAD